MANFASVSAGKSGQILTEYLITLLVTVPFVTGGLAWYCLETSRSKCAYQSFAQARQQLIRQNSTVIYQASCGKIQERIELHALEDLDTNKSGLSPSDLKTEVSQASVDVSLWWSRLQALGSQASSTKSDP